MFTLYVLVIAAGLALYIVIGLTHAWVVGAPHSSTGTEG